MWIIVGVLVIAGVWYALSRNVSNTSESMRDNTIVSGTSNTSSTVSSKGTSSSAYHGTVGGLLSRGGSYRCTFSRATSAGKTDGTVYISGSRLRGDFMTTFSSGTKAESHLLYLSGTAYAWTPPVQQGYKAKATATTLGTALHLSGSAGFDYGQTLDYSCAAWGGDAVLFEFPKGIVFSNV